MGKFVVPKVYFTGYQEMNDKEVLRYLKDSGNTEFWNSVKSARKLGLKSAEIICSLFAKLCYKALTLNHNNNLTRVRDIPDNLKGTFDQGHSSVFEHVNFNFIIADCSRIFTHELVRHRVGTAFSQNSGRYIRLDSIDLVWDPILKGCEDLAQSHLQATEDLVYRMECRKGLRVPPPSYPSISSNACLEHNRRSVKYKDYRWVPNKDPGFSFTEKKKLTSAIRRFAPNGQSNEIAVSINLRALRHTLMLRTAASAEWEIRVVFEAIYKLLKKEYPLIFHGAREKMVDGVIELSGMKIQPYETSPNVLLSELSDAQLEEELKRRKGANLGKSKSKAAKCST